MRKIFFLLLVTFTGQMGFAQVKVEHLQTENLPNPISIDATAPRFSWQLDAGSARNVMQAAYQIKVGLYKGPGKSTSVWAPAKMTTDESVYVPYQGPALLAGQKYTWQVKVWDNTGKASEWSAPATFQMGLLTPADWKAEWITAAIADDPKRPSPIFRKGFAITKKIASATAYITSHGVYEAQINGHRVGDAYFTPGYTSYNKRLQYQAYDVTNLLQTS